MERPLSPDAVVGSGRKELPAYLSNGVMGLRVREVPLIAGMNFHQRLYGRASRSRDRGGGGSALPLCGRSADRRR